MRKGEFKGKLGKITMKMSLLFSALFLIPALSAGAGEIAASTAPSSAEVSASTPAWVDVVWPLEGQEYPFVERSFTLGSVAPGSTLTINGMEVQPHAQGGFLAQLPFSTGTFSLDYEVLWEGQSASTRRVVAVGLPGGYPETEPDGVAALEPSEDLGLRPGDLVVARCKGPSGAKARLRVGSLAKDLLMAESPRDGFSIYEGHYFIQPGDRGEDHEVSCMVRTGLWSRGRAEARGKVSVWDGKQVRVAETIGKVNVLKSGDSGYTLFFPAGVRVEVIGRRGNMARVRLSEHEDGWLSESGIRFLPAGTPPPRGVVGLVVKTVPEADSVRVLIHVSEKLPFEVRHTIEPLGFDIRFFGADHHMDRVRYDGADPIVSDVRWRQESSRVVRVSVATRLRWGWGYDASYDEKGRFVLELRRPPDLSASDSVLAGRRVVVDAGHGPWKSALGPRGTAERDVNLDIAMDLQDMLLAEGADVYMIRVSSDGPSLVDRAFLAWEWKGDVYISIHNNAFPVAADPFGKPRGFMNFYYQPQSRPLVEAVHASYRKGSELADEFVRWGNLYVCRMTQMPSVLTESAYMSFPEQEALLLDPAYRRKLAGIMLEGLRSFYKTYQEFQRESPAERAAARK